MTNHRSQNHTRTPQEGIYDYDMQTERISPDEEISKEYILQYRDNYPQEAIAKGLINHGIPVTKVHSYIRKYYHNNHNGRKRFNATLHNFFTRIYRWMFIGILITFLTSFITVYTPLIYFFYGSAVIYYGIVAIQLILLFGTQLLINYFSPRISLLLYLLYCITMGITLSGLFLIYVLDSILVIFLVAASMFALLAFIGFITKKDISKWALFLIPAMWGIFFASVINIFLQNSFMDLIVSVIAVIIFSALTVYDNQTYKKVFAHIRTKDDYKRYSVLGAMHMYINFIMIFINLLKLFGGRD